MIKSDFARYRLFQQRLTQPVCATPEEAVTWSGAVQAQEYQDSKRSLAIRMPDASDAAIEEAFTAGRILRTHVMRPTWHFVAPQDIRWLLELTAPRVNSVVSSNYRQQNLDDALFARANDLFAKALEGGNFLTRQELKQTLADAGIEVDNFRTGFLVMRAELDAVICSGPRRGKQFTYALLAERAPHARSLPREEALAELTRRYYTSHGPATARDFSWWSGLTVAECKTGIEMLGSEFSSEVVDGQVYYFPAAMPEVPHPAQTAFLLPTYDEFLVGYSNFSQSRTSGQEVSAELMFESVFLYESRIIGSWKRTLKKNEVQITLAPFAPMTTDQEQAVFAAAERYGAFLGLPARCTIQL